MDYALTDLGRSLQPVLTAMRDWGMDYAQSQGLQQEGQDVQASCAA